MSASDFATSFSTCSGRWSSCSAVSPRAAIELASVAIDAHALAGGDAQALVERDADNEISHLDKPFARCRNDSAKKNNNATGGVRWRAGGGNDEYRSGRRSGG